MERVQKEIIDQPTSEPFEITDSSHVSCLRTGDWVFVSGQTVTNQSGEIVSSAFKPQAERAFENISALLDSANSSLNDVYHMTVWLTDMRLYEDFLTYRSEYLGDSKVSTTVVGADNLVHPEARILIEARALTSNSSIEKRPLDVPSFPSPRVFGPNHAHGVIVGDLVYLSGQRGVDGDHDLVSTTFDKQMRRVLENVTTGLGAGGSSTSDMLTMTTWMTDHRDRPSFHTQRSELLGTDVSTSTRVGVTGLSDPESFVEMEVIGVDSDVGRQLVDHPDELPLATVERDGETYPRFWQCVTAGDWLFTSGMVGVNQSFETVSPTFRPQAEKIFENLEIALNAAGADLDHLLHTRTYLTDMRYADEFFSVRDDEWGDVSATSTVTHSPLLAEKDFRLEIEAIALNAR